ncbi:MAG: aldehyde dehydrogenase family protein [Acetobacteraceae bacterium]|nr:aldehyde dehydrogenase family protein [Acetobacteraceae bacterium]
MFESRNPATGEVFSRYPTATDAEVDSALARAAAAQPRWAAASAAERAAALAAIAAALRAKAPELAALATAEMGKTIGEAEAEVAKCALTLDHYARHGEALLAFEPVATEAAESGIALDPLGVVLAVMPWNYPYWQVIRAAAPAWLAGNTVVLKHAPNTPGSAEALAAMVEEAAPGLLVNLRAGNDQVARMLADPRVAALSFTGSTATGAHLAAVAGANLKRSVLELGGADPFIVLADADLDAAASAAVVGRFQNNGQSCIAAKRFILEAPIADAFAERFAALAAALPIGDPAERGTRLGPLARADLRDALAAQAARAVAAGARVLTGGAQPDRAGFFFKATVLDRVSPDNPVAAEETFGPLALLFRVPDAESAVALANATEYGLGAAVFSRDLDRVRALSRRLQAGAVFANRIVASDPRVPFGGIKRSGWGRELGAEGVRAFANVKTLWFNRAT